MFRGAGTFMLVTPSKRKPSKWYSSSQNRTLLKQEPQHLGLAVIEQERVPIGVLATAAGVEVLKLGAVEVG